jgi:CRP-like cAMP-binding protein
MSTIVQTGLANKVLACLPAEDSRRLSQHLAPVKLSISDTIYNQGNTLSYVYFPLDSIISTVAIMSDGATVEIGMTGRESVVEIVAIFGERSARNWTRVLVPGHALRISSEKLREEFRRSENIERELMGCYRRVITQVSQRAVCSCRHTIMQRLCCWLLMVNDRVGADDMPLTHDLISQRLGARRAGITQAALALQGMKAVSYTRGHIHIADRLAIESMACECYLTFKDEFEWFENCGRGETAQLKGRSYK